MNAILSSPILAPLGVPEIGPLEQGPWTAYDTQQLVSGQRSPVAPLAFSSQAFDGGTLRSYFDDYYNRIWVISNQNVDFGEIAGPLEVTRSFWNAFLVPSTLSTVVENAENVIFSGVSPPQVFAPLQALPVVFSTNEIGPDVLSGTIEFTFSVGGIKILTFEGRRSLQWPTEDFRVNWDSPYEVEIEFRTDIFVSRNGKEQRRAQRRKPRKRITYQSIFDNKQLRKYNAIIASRQTRTFTIPEETKTVKLAASAATGTDTLVFDTVPEWVVPNYNYMLLLDNRREIVRVDSVSGNTVSLVGNLQNDWLIDDYLVPVHTVRTSTNISAPLVTNTVSIVNQTWEVEPTTEPFEQNSIQYDFYEGYPVFNENHNWLSSLSVEKNYNREEVDFGKGRVRYYTPIDFPNQVRGLSLLTESLSRIESIKTFFKEMRGRAGEFWLPTWERDLELIADVAVNTDRLLCEGTELFEYYPEDKVFRNIYMVLKDGTTLFRRIESYQLLGDNTEVQVTEPLPALTVGDVELICFLPRTRFASDTLTISWLTREVASANISFQTLEDI